MKKRILFILCFTMSIVASAQRQQGYVKTRGRIDNQGSLIPGHPLGEVEVKICDHGLIMSDKNGAFSFRVHNKDKSFYLDTVSKKGYAIIDPYLLSKRFGFSKNNLIITLETEDQQKKDRMNNYAKINTVQNEMIFNLRAEAKKLHSENRINDEEYYRHLSSIAAMYAMSYRLVNEMVEKYSRIDYDMLREFDRQIIALIINGEFNGADSLLKTTGIIENGANLADIYYYKSEIMKLQHQFDSAAYYLEKRVELDTANLEWIMEAAMLAKDYLGNYEKSIQLFEKGLHSITIHDKECYETALVLYNELGHAYSCMGSFDKALECYEMSLSLADEKTSDRNPNVADIYYNMSVVYANKNETDKAFEYLHKALNTCYNINGKEYYRIIQVYNHFGAIHSKIGEYDKALFNYEQALMQISDLFGENQADVVSMNALMGNFYFDIWTNSDLRNYRAVTQALNYYGRALRTNVEIYGEMHPVSADMYGKLGMIYYYNTQYVKALEYHRKACLIRKEIFGEEHRDYAKTCKMLGIIYAEIKDYKNALEYLNKSKTIIESLYGSEESEAMKIQTYITIIEEMQKEHGEE